MFDLTAPTFSRAGLKKINDPVRIPVQSSPVRAVGGEGVTSKQSFVVLNVREHTIGVAVVATELLPVVAGIL